MRQPIDQVPYDTVLDTTDRLLMVTTDNKLRQITAKNALKDATVIPVRFSASNLSSTIDGTFFDNGDHLGLYGMKLVYGRILYQPIANTDVSNYWRARFVAITSAGGDTPLWGTNLTGTDGLNTYEETWANYTLPSSSPMFALRMAKVGNPANTGFISITLYLTRA